MQRIQKLILLLFILTPIFSITEIFEYLGIGVVLPIDMFYIKLPKDILMIVVLFLSLTYSLRYKHPINYHICLFLLSAFTFICFFFSYSVNGIQIALAGIRWAIPLFLIILLYDISNHDLLEKTTKILFALLLLHITAQILEMIFMPPIWGLNALGLSGRLPGIFVHPSASGTFAAFCFFCFKYFLSQKKKMIGSILAIISVFLSMSSTGVILLTILLFMPIYLRSKYKLILSFVAILFIFLIITNLDLLTGRQAGDSELSGTTRVQILQEIVNSTELISTNFGIATNTAMNLLTKLGIGSNAFIADSLYTSFLTNYGAIFSILFIGSILYLLLYLFMKKNKDIPFILFFVISLLSGISIIIIEIFPINLIIALYLSYYLKKYSFLSDNLFTKNDNNITLNR